MLNKTKGKGGAQGIGKKLLLAAALGMASPGVYGQGQVVMNTCLADRYVKFSNTVASTFFTGNQVYVGLYWAADSATLANGGGSLATYADGLGSPAGTNGTGLAILAPNGLVNSVSFGGNRYIPGRAGLTTYFQLRAWSNPDGTILGYEAALLAGPGVLVSRIGYGVGAAPIVSFTPTSVTVPPPVPLFIPWSPGSTSSGNGLAIALEPRMVYALGIISEVPEPSTFALAGLGLCGLYCLHRRKR